MKTPYKKAHKIGGSLPVFEEIYFLIFIFHFPFKGLGFKLFDCFEANTCNDWSNISYLTIFEPLQHFM